MLTNVEPHKNLRLWNSLLGRMDFIKNSIADLKESKGAQQNRIEFLEIELAKARSEICQLRSDIQQVKEENRLLKEQTNELRASLQAAHSAVEKKQKAVKDVAEVKMRPRISSMRCFFETKMDFLPLSLAFFGFILYFCRNSTKMRV